MDASVAVKWLFPEVHADSAKRLLKRDRELIAPDLIWAEVTSAVCKRVRRHEIDAEDAFDMVKDFQRYPIRTFESKNFIDTALMVAQEADVSVYDGLYLSLAYSRDCSLVTADRKLYDKIFKAYPQSEAVWLEDLK